MHAKSVKEYQFTYFTVEVVCDANYLSISGLTSLKATAGQSCLRSHDRGGPDGNTFRKKF